MLTIDPKHSSDKSIDCLSLTHPSPHAFGLRRLSFSIAIATLLSACGAIQSPSGSVSDENDVGTESSRAIGNRNAGARVNIEPGVTSTDEDQVFETVWDRIGSGLEFSFSHENERIDSQIAFYTENAEFLRVVSERASPFVFSIVEELERREMPLEFALLPIIESAYNPNATGSSDAVGLWQIISATGRSLGLRQDWWYDGRRDPVASTSAALDYLASLHQMFGEDWLLALAAYNSGQGTVQNAIEQNTQRLLETDYWSLSLPSITQEYIPRLIALGRLFSSPEQYGLELAELKNEQVLTSVDIGGQIDLSLAADIAGLDRETLHRLNPGLSQWATHPDGPHTLVMPITHVGTFTTALASLGDPARVTWDRYVVQPGDTLSKIAKEFRTQVAALQQANDIEGSRIVAGESLLIPRASIAGLPLQVPDAPYYVPGVAYSADSNPAPTRYEIKSGDSLWRIANRYNLSTAALARWNNIDESAVLRPGQVLNLAADTAVAQTDQDVDRTTIYRVKSGESLARIARKFGVGVSELSSWNNISETDLIHPGQQLVLRPGESKMN